ncbi:PQQ-binding-like beta-propeller repeat protein [candidate division WOR-3 bacterium]|nr:PQQ-binding-like beta-propeller repeat protein [candidate division WOR-3 bacterium]
MKRLIIVWYMCLTALSAQSVIWSYYAPSGGIYAHFRATRTIADVDADLHDDVIAVSENDTLYCFSGMTGVPIWRFAADPCYVERGLISVSDLDGDTIADVILGTVWGTRSVFAISGADGSVIWMYDTHEYGQGGWIYEVSSTEDITGDGIPEILASSGGPDAKRVYMFNGATGAKVWEYNAGYACYGVQPIGDINGDAISDIAVATGNYVASAYRVKLLDGLTGTLIREVALPASGLTVVGIGDINADLIPDVACGTGNGTILALSGADGSTLWTAGVGGMVWDLSLLPDIDNNGFPELLPSGTGMNSAICLDALTGNTNWATPVADQVFVNVAIADISEDGIWDVVAGTGYTNSVLYVLDGGSGGIYWQYSIGSPVESAYWIEDIDGNSIPDILVGTRNGWLYAFSDGNVGITDQGRLKEEFTLLTSRFGRLEIRHNLAHGTPLHVALFSILGRKVMDRHLRADRNPLDINVTGLPAGVYFGRVSGPGFDARVKFVVID